jgi:cystathionine beta-lyase/cystathionine gamma-synthase
MSDLAIPGDRPVRNTLLPYGHQSIDEKDIQAVVKVLRSDWITTGPTVGEFEEAFAGYVGARHAVSFSSGTAALHGAAFAPELEPAAEAITTPLTFCATANCGLRWTVDEPEYLQFVRRIYEHFNAELPFGVAEILAFLTEHPELGRVNSRFKRNEGYQTSVQGDNS